MIDDEVGKYKKRSTAKGQPRSKHKHKYETVLLIRESEVPDLHTGKQKKIQNKFPTKVCQLCGRIDYVDQDPSYYNIDVVKGLPYHIYDKKLSEKAEMLTKWFCNSFDKFAHKMESIND